MVADPETAMWPLCRLARLCLNELVCVVNLPRVAAGAHSSKNCAYLVANFDLIRRGVYYLAEDFDPIFQLDYPQEQRLLIFESNHRFSEHRESLDSAGSRHFLIHDSI